MVDSVVGIKARRGAQLPVSDKRAEWALVASQEEGLLRRPLADGSRADKGDMGRCEKSA